MSAKARPEDYGRIMRSEKKRRRPIRGNSWRARALRAERRLRKLRQKRAR